VARSTSPTFLAGRPRRAGSSTLENSSSLRKVIRAEAGDAARPRRLDCGNDDLNDWLVTSARTATGHGTRARGSEFDAPGEPYIGYFSVLPRQHRSPELGRRGRGAPELIPAICSGKLWAVSHVGNAKAHRRRPARLRASASPHRRSSGGNGWSLTPSTTQPSFYEKHGFESVPTILGVSSRSSSTSPKPLELDWPAEAGAVIAVAVARRGFGERLSVGKSRESSAPGRRFYAAPAGFASARAAPC
jgi:hypothetical protein